MIATVPTRRVRAVNDCPVHPNGAFVLYWITGNRRSRWNYSLQRAVDHAVTLGKPLVVLELLSCALPWGSDRIHAAILDGMANLADAFAEAGVTYHPFAERHPGEAGQLLKALGDRACLVVTDDFPCYIVPGAVADAGAKLNTRLEAVDSNGLLPMDATDQAFTLAHAFRRYLHKHLAPHLRDFPVAEPLSGLALPPGAVPADVAARFPATPGAVLWAPARDYGA
ncbi:MAG: deoxyribodipyrimidine photolyase, partial [Candidatus Sericytochromatia bacterium]